MSEIKSGRNLLVAVASSLLVLAGCGAGGGTSGGAIIAYSSTMTPTYNPNDPRRMPEIPTVIAGPAPDGSTPAEVMAATQPTGRLSQSKIVPGRADVRTDRLIIAFAPALPDSLCRGELPATVNYADKIEMTTAYCRNYRAMSGTQLKTSITKGPKDENWQRMVKQIYSNTFPAFNPDYPFYPFQ